MGEGDFSDDFKRDAVAQITERGYPVAEASKLSPVEFERQRNMSTEGV